MDINLSELSFFRPIIDAYQTIRANTVLNFMLRVFLALTQLWVSSLAVVWSSVFIYLMFYYSYVPLVSTTKEVYIQYDSHCNRDLLDSNCGKPFAEITLRHGRSPDFLRGQSYKFSIDLRLPESDVNWKQGLFMIRLRLMDQKKKSAISVAKPTGLKYKSPALRYINTLLFWPLFTMGLAEESQTVTVNLMDDFVEGSYPRVGPVTDAILEFDARDVQIYPPTVLRVEATLTGLRYLMYNYWLLSFLAGTTSISFFLYILTLIGFSNYYLNYGRNGRNPRNNNNNGLNTDSNNEVINTENVEQIGAETNRLSDESEKLSSRLTGEVSAEESGSEGSSTLVIPEVEEIDRQIDDMNQMPDSSIG